MGIEDACNFTQFAAEATRRRDSGARLVVGLRVPTKATRAEAGRVNAVMTGRTPAVVVRRVDVAAGVLIRRVRELEIELVVGAHRIAPGESVNFSSV